MQFTQYTQLPISEYQKRFFLEWALAPESSAYNLYAVYKISGALNQQLFKRACAAVIEQHEIVHAKYNQDGSECHHARFTINDIYHVVELDNEISAIDQIVEIVKKPFNLLYGKLLQFYLLVNSHNPHVTYFVLLGHHIIIDAQSKKIFLDTIVTYYNKQSTTQPDRRKSFVEAVAAETKFIANQRKGKAKQFWADYIANLPLNIDFLRNNAVQTAKSMITNFALTKENTRKLARYAQNNNTTVFIVLFALYGVIISKYSNQKQSLISYPVNMRQEGYANVAGCFVNNLPLKIDCDNNKTLRQLITDITMQRETAKTHLWYSFTDIVHDQRIIRQEYNQPYFNVGFASTDLNLDTMILEQLAVTHIHINNSQHSIYLLLLKFDYIACRECLQFELEYQEDLVDKELIHEFVKSFLRLLEEFLQTDDIIINKYCVLDQETYNKVIYVWNNTYTSYPEHATIHHMFEEQVLRTPDAIAIKYEEVELSYQQLNIQANQLAHYLKTTYQIAPDDLLAFCLDRTEWAITVILGILKSGGAYVPIDPQHPRERISYILQDINTKVIITNSAHKNKLHDMVINQFAYINDDWPRSGFIIPSILVVDNVYFSHELKQYAGVNLNQTISSRNLAYIIYTSGTTGTPKGVMLEHSGIVANALSIGKHREIYQSSQVLCNAPFIFDSSVMEIFPALFCGARVSISPEHVRKDVIAIRDYCMINNITHVFLTTRLAEEFAQVDLSNLKLVCMIVAGEKLATALTMSCKVVNEYGPTESSVCATAYTVNQRESNSLIGKAIANTKLYVLDNDLLPLPIGSIGELYLGGIGLARGYLHQETLTNTVFIKNPFQSQEDIISHKNTKIYKTGDLVKYLPDGNLEYIGRNDSQIKLRGFRIELSEIENRLTAYPGIKQAAVILKNNILQGKQSSAKYLLAYYVSNAKIDQDKLLYYLGQLLPDYMLPSALMHLEKLPLTFNGKLDTNALPLTDLIVQSEYMAPRNELELEICAIFAKTLGLSISTIGIADNFFKLGGDSILAIKLVNAINAKYESHLKVIDVFNEGCIKNLVEIVIYTKNKYQLLTRLNNASNNKPVMLMIHPAFSGCEVYAPLANKLINTYLCYGIDNHNLYNTEKILNLHELASHYWKVTQKSLQLCDPSRKITLLGWSLGGLIALEIAVILEQENYQNIKIYLLDTIIRNKKFKSTDIRQNNAIMQQQLQQHAHRYDSSYLNKIIDNYAIEIKMCSAMVSSKLHYANIVLYKPVAAVNNVVTNRVATQCSVYNNVDSVVNDVSQITTVDILGGSHDDMLEQILENNYLKNIQNEEM